MDNSKKIPLISLAIVLIISAFLLGYSFDTLEPTEYGLEYNANLLHLNKEVIYESGRYFLGINHYFIKFPRTVVTITFSGYNDISARTKDGLKLNLDISFNYRLKSSQLVRLYLDWGEEYEKGYIKIARNVIRDVASDFDAFQYFNNRTLIQTQMMSELTSKFDDVGSYIDTFQLRNVQLPNAFENAIEQTQIAFVDIGKAVAEKEQALVQADTIRQSAIQQAVIVGNEANATAEAVIFTANAQAEALKAKVAAERESYLALRSSLNLTDPSTFLTYIWVRAIQDSGAENMVLDVTTPPSIKNFFENN